MLCDLCHKREVKIYVKKIEYGKKIEYNLCEVCASEIMGSAISIPDFQADFLHSISDMLAGFSDIDTDELEEGLKCQKCGLTVSDFQETGRLGCEECYETFSGKIEPLLQRLQGSIQHAGKVPPGLEQRHEIENLRKELQISIEKEEYERSAVIRDKIKEVEKNKNRVA